MRTARYYFDLYFKLLTFETFSNVNLDNTLARIYMDISNDMMDEIKLLAADTEDFDKEIAWICIRGNEIWNDLAKMFNETVKMDVIKKDFFIRLWLKQINKKSQKVLRKWVNYYMKNPRPEPEVVLDDRD